MVSALRADLGPAPRATTVGRARRRLVVSVAAAACASACSARVESAAIMHFWRSRSRRRSGCRRRARYAGRVILVSKQRSCLLHSVFGLGAWQQHLPFGACNSAHSLKYAT